MDGNHIYLDLTLDANTSKVLNTSEVILFFNRSIYISNMIYGLLCMKTLQILDLFALYKNYFGHYLTSIRTVYQDFTKLINY